MPEKLTSLYNLFHSGETIHSPQVTSLISEILGTFGLPPNQEYEKILMDFCGADELTEEGINETLIKLADEGIYYQVLIRLVDS